MDIPASEKKTFPPASIEQLYQLYLKHPSVSTDTRQVQAGDLFFALKGENFNGNRFAFSALEKGAAYAVIDEEIPDAARWNDRLIRVEDVLTTLQMLAGRHRNQFSIPFIAITGSNGKTTTKELVQVPFFRKNIRPYTTQGNLNNHIGIPLTLLKIKKDAEISII